MFVEGAHKVVKPRPIQEASQQNGVRRLCLVLAINRKLRSVEELRIGHINTGEVECLLSEKNASGWLWHETELEVFKLLV